MTTRCQHCNIKDMSAEQSALHRNLSYTCVSKYSVSPGGRSHWQSWRCLVWRAECIAPCHKRSGAPLQYYTDWSCCLCNQTACCYSSGSSPALLAHWAPTRYSSPDCYCLQLQSGINTHMGYMGTRYCNLQRKLQFLNYLWLSSNRGINADKELSDKQHGLTVSLHFLMLIELQATELFSSEQIFYL